MFFFRPPFIRLLVQYTFPHAGDVSLDTGAQLQFPAQRPQTVSDGGDLAVDSRAALPRPAPLVKLPALVCQGVDLRLDGVILHGKLLRCFYAGFHQIAKLFLIAVKLDDLTPHRKSRPVSRTA